MKKSAIISVLILLLLSSAVMHLSAETVYVDELKKAGESDAIIFQNYSGPHNRIDSIEDIRGIGRFLGRNVGSEPDEFTYFGKYTVIHAVDPSDLNGLDGDIFIIDKSASVDHINNLRRMISGYLEAAYGYDIEQADLLAEFITVYNAVHRFDLAYFTTIYKKIVTKHLSDDKAGIALSYLEWPGNTMMVIPLTPQAGDDVISDIDTDILSDEDVINQLRKEDDKGIDSRQDLVDLKDEEVLEERDKIEDTRDKIEEREKELVDKKEILEEEVKDLEDDKSVEAEVKIKEIKEELKIIEEEEKELVEEVKALDKREEKVEEREQQIVEEREEIAKDQMKLIEEIGDSSDKAVDAVKKTPKIVTALFLKVSGGAGDYTGQLLLVDTAAGNIVKQSEVDSIRLRSYHYSGDEIISVAGSEGSNRIVSLVRIDPETLEILESGTVEVYIDSAVIEASGKYYAVVDDGGVWKIGIFNDDLVLEKVSDTEVFPATDIVITDDDIIVQSPFGRIMKINNEDFNSPAF